MMKVELRTLGMIALLLSPALAQTPAVGGATLQDVLFASDHGELKVRVIMSTPVEPSVIIAHHPERIILRLPNTVDRRQRGKIQLHTNGVRALWTTPSAEDSKNTDVVIELEHARPYAFRSDNGEIVLTFNGNSKLARHADGAAPGVKGGVLTGIFHRHPDSSRAETTTTAQAPAPASTVGVFGKGGLPEPPQINSQSTKVSVPQNGSPGQNSSVNSSAGQSSQNRQPVSMVQPRPVVQTVPQSISPVAAPAETAASSTQSIQPDASHPLHEAPPAQSSTEDSNQQANATRPEQPAAAATNEAKEPVLAIRATDPSLRTVFHVKYVAEGIAYLDGGRSAGLKEGVKLEIQDTDLPARDGTAVSAADPRVVAELEVSAVAETSAVTDIRSAKRPVKPGDLAYLSSADSEALVQETALSPTRKYPAVVSFTLDDPQDEEAREQVPRPPMPSVNRARGRMGASYMGSVGHGAGAISSANYGMMFRGDITRINGTYWNLSGYWVGRFNRQSPQAGQTLQDLINRTYHLDMTYDNPNSAWVAGFGRLYLPWATSLDTIDGGYFGRKISSTGTAGMFVGSTPDPTSYDYSPNRQIAGTFLNFTGGDFANVHYSSTVGAGTSLLSWKLDRPFGFLENTISYKQSLSLYDALQVDSPVGNPAVPAPGTGLSRNFLTVRVQPISRLEFDFNHTYFRDIPTFDPTLIGTGLLDKYLFQGFSIGTRAEVLKQVSVYTQLGRSSRTGDASSSLNQLYGINFARLPWYGLRADFHYAQFNSSFGSGRYKSLSISRIFADNVVMEVLGGQQSFSSTMTSQGRSWFVNSRIETNLGSHYFVQGNYTINRGQMNYDQWMLTFGLRFDSKGGRQ